jgi:hypothetical protein
MHSIKNISERNKIDIQSRAEKLKNPKNFLFWANIYKKKQKTKKTKKQKKT